ncbi:hypothetical protein [Halocatena marina]|uniref:Uncharacterized protein n=1 Tax=Halocatena marina TaxID=2934937 RepID=A0ABD5YT37_9EURY|nr:hypothetical protein [Halocatena marina]
MPGAPSNETEDASASLFRDSMFDVSGKAWIHSLEISVATATDSGRFLYRGTLDLDIATGHDTHWAPEILYHDKTDNLDAIYFFVVP